LTKPPKKARFFLFAVNARRNFYQLVSAICQCQHGATPKPRLSPSGLKAFNANRGLQSAGVFVSGYQRLSADWTGFARLNLNKLQGDAANSPITRSTSQTSLVAGASYAF